MVGDLPAGVIRQWRRWCLHPRYSAGAEGPAITQRYAQVRFPLLAWSFGDDELMTLRGIHHLVDLYAGAPRQVQTIRPADAGVHRIGHFGFFRDGFRATLWPRSLAALQSLGTLATAGVAQRTDNGAPVTHTIHP
jgi:predicted alpha/beta hydrolase